MRVHIEHHEKSAGLMRNIPQVEVAVQVEFSEEERLIIKARRLEDTIVLQREPDSHQASKIAPEDLEEWAHSFHLRISHLLKNQPDRFAFDTPNDAKLYQHRLIDALKQLKIFLVDNATLALPADFEL